MMRAGTTALLCFNIIILLASKSEGSVIKNISFTGNRLFSSTELREMMAVKSGSPLNVSLISRDILTILTRYHEKGYYFAAAGIDTLIYPADSSTVEVGIYISEGSEITVGEVVISGNSILTEKEILENFRTRIGGHLLPAVLEEDIDNLLVLYGRTGFPFASVDVRNISLLNGGGEISLTVGVEEGTMVTIDEIEVAGNTATRADVIIRESRIRLHETYNADKVGRIRDRLSRLNIFSKVDEPEVYSTPYGGGVIVRVTEGKTTTVSGILGYVPSNEGDGSVTGMIDIGMRNLLGTGRKFHVRWLKDERQSQDIRLGYTEPWIFNFPMNASIRFDQRQQDTTYVRRSFSLQGDLLVDESLTLSAAAGQQTVIPSENTTRLVRSSAVMGGLEIAYDTRDRMLNTSRGVAYNTRYSLERKKTDLERTTLQRLSVDLDVYVQTFDRQVLFLGLHGRTLNGGGIGIGDLYRFGGTNSFRGYRENQFLGKDVAWTNLEYRFILGARAYVYGFFDTGYFLLPAIEQAGINSTKDYLAGYGAGIRLETAIGNVGISFGFGEGDSFFEGKVHIGIINEF